ncbi:hypothetical protein B0T14DRAFT_222654 [Immersiella caudata]|uniref:Uncharacterized protein n=1 Tax=Immersiella caudata TaxID=314043 RepID=A0AA40BZP3_9PEZI|nr:hypothetical protein B0T14DRAFT_222654 [Immersiella caudata]
MCHRGCTVWFQCEAFCRRQPFETSLGAIARLKSFETAVKPEDKVEGTQQPPTNWPSCGSIEFRNVTMSYEK